MRTISICAWCGKTEEVHHKQGEEQLPEGWVRLLSLAPYEAKHFGPDGYSFCIDLLYCSEEHRRQHSLVLLDALDSLKRQVALEGVSL